MTLRDIVTTINNFIKYNQQGLITGPVLNPILKSMSLFAHAFAKDTWQNSVVSIETGGSPEFPSSESRYLIQGGSGDWAGKDAQIAQWNETEWVYIAPKKGMRLYVQSTNSIMVYEEVAEIGEPYVYHWQSEASSGTTESIITDLSVGNIYAQSEIPEGTGFTQYLKMLHNKIFEPTAVAPSLNLSISGATIVERGTTIERTLTATLNRGSILGKLVSGVWQPNTEQNPRSGVALSYTIDGVAILPPNPPTLDILHVVTEGDNTFSASVDHDQGPQPTNSKGEASTLSPLSAGTLNDDVIVIGQKAIFYGTSTPPPDDSSDVRLMTKILDSGGQIIIYLNTTNTDTSFTVSVPMDRQVVQVIDETALNSEIPVGEPSGYNIDSNIPTVPDADGVALAYKVYVMTIAAAYDDPHTHRITIQ